MTYRVLIIEDEPTDAELNEREIRQVLTPCIFKRVETEEDFLRSLDEFKPDIIVSDYMMPSFNGMTALKLTLERTPLIPFIIVTGSMNEETAVECMKSGATNYVIKQHIKRLGPAVLHALEEKKIRMERLAAREALKESEDKYRNVVERANDGIAIIQDEIVKYVNTHLAEIWGGKVEELIGTVFSNYVDSEALPNLIDKYKRRIAGENIAPIYETVLRRKDGSKIYAEINAGVITFQGKPADLIIIRDVTERKKAEEKMEYLAYYDTLTGLPNRNLFIYRLDLEIAGAEQTSSFIAVLITDINKFKAINDTYGHEVGDRILKEVAERLSRAIRKRDLVARLANDEFGIACMGITSSDDIIALEKLIEDASYPLTVDKDEIPLDFRTGISLYPHDGENASELLKAAGLALSMAKKEVRKGYQFYNEDMSVMASEIMFLERQLSNAIKNKAFVLHYQPYWDINTKKMVGMEALVRWQSKDKGLIPPGKFIPVLEDTGMIIEVGEWILREAVRQVKEWQNNGYPVVPVSVNLSLIQFRQRDLTDMVKRAMGEFGFYPSLLTLEITESAFMQDIEFTNSILQELKGIGCSISIDDFGTGYSSLSHLKRFPIDNLKIDISFVREMVLDPDSASIVMAIINMAHTLNLKTIAEGIETEEQWNFLRLLRCDMGQGFYFSKPLPAEDIEKFFKQQ